MAQVLHKPLTMNTNHAILKLGNWKRTMTKFGLRTLLNVFLAIAVAVTSTSAIAVQKKGKHGAYKASKHHVIKSKARTKTRASKYGASKRSKYAMRVSSRKTYRMNQQNYVESYDAYDGSTPLYLSSSKAIVVNQNSSEIVYSKNINLQTPIASVTKLMTAMVVLDAKLNLDEAVSITESDIDYLKGTSSRLALGTTMTREDLLNLALIASENRAASALATSYPGGRGKFVRDMNLKAQSLGMTNSNFADSTGLDSSNVSTAEDLAKMVHAAYQYPIIREISTSPSYSLYLPNRNSAMVFNNTNALVRNVEGDWQIGLSKTGYISEAGRCLVMQATIAGEPLIMVLLDSDGKYTRIGDANRVRKWVEHQRHNMVTAKQQSQVDPMMLSRLTIAKTLTH